MAGKEDRRMGRSVQQAMYRYLPGRWINFYIKSSRDGFSAYVTNWNSVPLEGANINRIKREVWHRLEALGDRVKRFAPLWSDAAWSVLTPKTGDVNSAIIAEVSPLLFFCSNPKCRRVAEYRFSDQFLRNYTNNMHCKFCNPSLPAMQRPAMTQVQMVYYCECGWAGPVKKPYASCGCNAPLMQKDPYTYACTKCHRTYDLSTSCPECSKHLSPRNALDNAQFYSHSFNLIDLVDEDREHYIDTNIDGRYLTIAYWLGLLERDRYLEILQYKLHSRPDQTRESIIEKQVEILRAQIPGLPEEQLRLLATQLTNASDPLGDVEGAIQQAKDLLSAKSDDDKAIREVALRILEYDTVLHASETMSLATAASTAVLLNEIDIENRYNEALEAAHISSVQASGKVPFVMAVYGYSRTSNDIKGPVKICAFSQESATRSNIYATRMETEGIIFELDRRAVLRWLVKNNVITSLDYQETMSEAEVKAWFLRSCNQSSVSVFGEIDESIHKPMSWVFKLLHSISHELIRQASRICGLDKSSISEYLFAEIPAVFVYCQNTQGFNLGAMFSAMEAQLNVWITSAMEEIQQCVFDPVCRDETGACAGCLFLTDVSCHYMNKLLDRRLLTGYTRPDGTRVYGFWEEW